MEAFFSEFDTALVGRLTLTSDGALLTGCRFERDRRLAQVLSGAERCDDLPAFRAARAWLERYFAGERPDGRELAALTAHEQGPEARSRGSEAGYRQKSAKLCKHGASASSGAHYRAAIPCRILCCDACWRGRGAVPGSAASGEASGGKAKARGRTSCLSERMETP